MIVYMQRLYKKINSYVVLDYLVARKMKLHVCSIFLSLSVFDGLYTDFSHSATLRQLLPS